MSQAAAIMWFRNDLRLADNPALAAAHRYGGPVIPVFVWAPEEEGDWPPGGASRWWLHQSLASLQGALQEAGSRLIIRQGPSLGNLRDLLKETGATAVFWNRRYEPATIPRDRAIKESLKAERVTVESFNGALLHEPWEIANQSGKPYQVFTPYWKACLSAADPNQPLPARRTLTPPKRWPKSLPLEALELEPNIDWAQGLRDTWQPGTQGAHHQLQRFLQNAFHDYAQDRNRPDLLGTSRLSPHLHFGEISPREIWHALKANAEKQNWPAARWRQSQFLAEVGWREFAHHLLFHFPETPHQPLRSEFKRFPWHRNTSLRQAWEQGRTGYPLVDAGLRELWATGWMHNRVRMVVASFLVKDLLIPWQEGAAWFWDTLVDADLANNTLGWQWTAGCGADAAPFFRIFNPVTQGEKFDPQGDYVRRWIPELKNLPTKWIFRPWEANENILQKAGVVLGTQYPEPIVSHSIAREAALEAYQRIKG